MADPPESIDDLTECREEDASVLIVYEDVLASVAATGDVVDSAFELDVEWSSHGGSLADSDSKIKL